MISSRQNETINPGNAWRASQALFLSFLCLASVPLAHAQFASLNSAPVNSNALADAGLDVNPRTATDDLGGWIAIWSSTENLNGAIGTIVTFYSRARRTTVARGPNRSL